MPCNGQTGPPGYIQYILKDIIFLCISEKIVYFQQLRIWVSWKTKLKQNTLEITFFTLQIGFEKKKSVDVCIG